MHLQRLQLSALPVPFHSTSLASGSLMGDLMLKKIPVVRNIVSHIKVTSR